MLKDRKGLLTGESDGNHLYNQRLPEPFLSFNTKQKPHIKSPKSRALYNKNYIGQSPDLFLPSKYKRSKSGLAM